MNQQPPGREVVVLCYHALSRSWDASLSATPEQFERQIAHLLRRGWRPATFHDAVTGDRPGRILAITFDDAFRSVLDLAAPILTRLGAPATVFVPSAYVDAEVPLDWPEVAHWKRTGQGVEMRAMTWNDLRGLAAQGWEIGSHTCTHPWLTQLDDDELTRELTDSRRRCSAEIGSDCRTIAYPFGDVDRRVVAAAAAAGYTAGARLSRGLQNLGPLSYPRIGIYHEDTWLRFRVKVLGPMRQLRASSLWPETALSDPVA